MRLNGKTAIITGASGAIGSVTADRFLEEGANVVLADINPQSLRERFMGAPESRTLLIGADVTSLEANKLLIQSAIKAFGGFDIFFANAGVIGERSDFADYASEDFDHVMNVNVKGVFYGVQAALPLMRDNGSIILTSSITGIAASPKYSPYSISKAAVVGMRRNAAVPAGERGIRVNTIHPGFVDSPMFWGAQKSMGFSKESRPFEDKQKIKGYIKPQEVADAVVFLASDESCAITDQAIVVDRGVVGS